MFMTIDMYLETRFSRLYYNIALVVVVLCLNVPVNSYGHVETFS